MRLCRICEKEKEDTSFQQMANKARRRVCKACMRSRNYERNPEAALEHQARKRARYPDMYVVIESRSSDKKKGLAGNDLDREFVREALAKSCTYCGGFELKMTLDRKDNSKAHTKSNVTPCCIRCNLLRGSMPYEAWSNIAPAVRDTFEKGLFGDWRNNPIKKKKRNPTV